MSEKGSYNPFGDVVGQIESRLGSRGEELRELAARPLQTDEYRQAEMEVLLEMVQLLADVAENTGGTTRRSTTIVKVGDDTDASVGTAPGTEPHGTESGVAASYFSTGVDGVTVAEPEWNVAEFGLTAEEVNVRHTGNVDISLVDPTNDADATIPLFEESSVTLGEFEGAGATRLFYRLPPRASSANTIYILAQ